MARLISMDISYSIAGTLRPPIRYEDQRVTSSGVNVETTFPRGEYETAINELRDFNRRVRASAFPSPEENPPSEFPGEYDAQRRRTASGDEVVEITVGDLVYEASYDSSSNTITVLEYSPFDVSWPEWVWALEELQRYLDHIQVR